MRLVYLYIILIINLIVFKQEKAQGQCSEKDIINLKKIAIVFGEKSYKFYGPLNNTINDANDISDSLRKVGFVVFTYIDDNKKAMEEHTNDWFNKLKNYNVALFYFSGHGAEVNSQNYLFPIDAEPKSPSELQYKTFSANQMLDRLQSSNLKYSIVILDACRSNPFTKSWSRDLTEQGLALMSAKGSFIAFAASPGATALDGNNRNGTYTEAILKYLTVPNLTIDEIFTRVNASVKKSTSGDQDPFKTSSLGSDYCFSVVRTFRPSIKSKFSSFQQPNSDILLSQDEQYLFTIESNNGGLSIRDAKTKDIISTIKTGLEHSFLIACKNDGMVYLTDSISHTINAIDWRKRQIVQSIKVEYSPLALLFSIDGKKMYVCGNNKQNGVISEVDLHANSVVKTIQLTNEISKMIISADGKQLFVSSKSNFKRLTIIDVKSGKIVKETNDLDLGDALGITPDGKKLYISSSDNKTIKILDVTSLQPTKLIQTPALSFAFTTDSKYLYAINESKITLIECATDQIMYDYPFVTPPKGVAITTTGDGYAWLPTEQNVFSFPVNDTTRTINAGSDLETNFKRVKEILNNDQSQKDEVNKINQRKDSCNRMTNYTKFLSQQVIAPVIRQILVDLDNKNYTTFGSSEPYTNCPVKLADFLYGIRSVLDEKKSIQSTFRFQFLTNEIILNILDNNDSGKEPQTFKISLMDIKENIGLKGNKDNSVQLLLDSNVEIALKKVVREYFLKRIQNLIK